jgi:hypothetical protein
MHPKISLLRKDHGNDIHHIADKRIIFPFVYNLCMSHEVAAVLSIDLAKSLSDPLLEKVDFFSLAN